MKPRYIVRDVSHLSDEEAFRQLLPTVSQTRQEKAQRFKFPMGGALSLGAALVLDELLIERGLRERDQYYVMGKHGKPSLAGHPEIHFSLSHSGHFVAAAISDREVGIDIQHRVKVSDALMRRVCGDNELSYLQTLGDEARQMAFIRLWTLKESWFKAVGTGITDDYPVFDITTDKVRLLNHETPCLFYEFTIDDGWGAVCVIDTEVPNDVQNVGK